MKTIKSYRVCLIDGSGIISEEQTFEVKHLKVIGENDTCFVVDNERFTTIEKKKSDYLTCLDQYSISVDTNDTCWGNRIHLSVFTEKNISPATIQKKIKDHIDKKFGFFMSGSFNLEFIK